MNHAAEPSVPQPVVSPPANPSNIFRGPNGIRAGWRALIFLAIVAGLVGAVNLVILLVAQFVLHHRPHVGMTCVALAGCGCPQRRVAVSVRRHCRADYDEDRAPEVGRIRTAGEFCLSQAFLDSELWLGSSRSAPAFWQSSPSTDFILVGIAIHGKTIVLATAAWTAAFVIVGLGEEFAFRGYLQFTLTTGMGFWPAAILLSALFGLAHAANPGESKFGLLSVVCFGLLFCLFLRRTGNLWWAVGFHAGWDWGQTFFYGVTDSGLAPYHNLFNSCIQRATVAYRRHGWSGGQRFHSDGSADRRSPVQPCVSRKSV